MTKQEATRFVEEMSGQYITELLHLHRDAKLRRIGDRRYRVYVGGNSEWYDFDG